MYGTLCQAGGYPAQLALRRCTQGWPVCCLSACGSSDDPKHRMVWCPPSQLLVRGVGVHAEEPPRLPLPPAQVSAQHRWFHLVRELGYPDLLTPSADLQLRHTGRAQVTHPLRLAAWGQEIPCALDLDRIHWHLLHLTRLPPAHGQHMCATHTESQLGQGYDERIDHARRHGVRLLIVCHGCSLLSAAMRTYHTPVQRSGRVEKSCPYRG